MPPACVDVNVYEMSEKERARKKVSELPGTLYEAILEMEKDAFVKEALGREFSQKYIDAKKSEWNAYKEQVTAWEMERYLYKY